MTEQEFFINGHFEEVCKEEDKFLDRLKGKGATASLIVDIVDGTQLAELTTAIQHLFLQDESKDTMIEKMLRNVFMDSLRQHTVYTIRNREFNRHSAVCFSNPPIKAFA